MERRRPLENMEKLNGKSVLVTGGTGLVGSHLVEELIRQKAHVLTTFQTLHPKSYFATKKLSEKVILVNADIDDFDKLFHIVTKFKTDYIFHLAAQPIVETAYANPRETFNVNIMGTVNIFECARLYPRIKGVIFASSDKAYGKLHKEKYLESDPLQGDHPYDVSKSAADLIANTYVKTYGLPIVTSRFGNIYGEGDMNFSRLIPGIMRSLIFDTDFEIRSDGEFIRDYLYVKDVVAGYIKLAENISKVKGQAFNFGSPECLSVLDVIGLIEKSLDKKLHYSIMNIAKNEIPYQSLDYTKVKKTINWKPVYTIKKTVPDILLWYKKYFEK